MFAFYIFHGNVPILNFTMIKYNEVTDNERIA